MPLRGTLLVGIAVGLLSRYVTRNRGRRDGFIRITLGMVGAFVAAALGKASHLYLADDPAGVIASTLGAMALLFGYSRVLPREVLSAGKLRRR
jgi:uncharacterized membrane protein YeaQ/YmgE (transglycosylase-associated protein family)